MNHSDVLLVGVIDPAGKEESFVYSLDAPTNLWIGALCDDGTRMSPPFMAHILNGLIEDDSFEEGDMFMVSDQNGTTLIATVGAYVSASSVHAFQSLTHEVRKVTVSAREAPDHV